MREQSLASKRSQFYEAYREYVEFLSQLRMTHPFSSILQSMSSIIILSDLLYTLAPNDSFIRQLTYLGISNAIMEIINSASSIVFYLLAGQIILLLLSPIIAIVTMRVSSIKVQKYRNGVFKQIYQNSLINCALRSFLGSFVLLFLPLFASLSVKFMQLGAGQAVLGALILVLALFNAVLVEYHTFDFGSDNRDELVVVNHPYRMVDDLLITIGLVSINASGVLVGQFLGMFLIGLRLALSVYFPFYLDRNQKVHQATLIAVLIIEFGMFVSQFGEEHYLFLVIAASLLGILVKIRAGQEEVEWQALAASQGGDQLGQIRIRLFKERLFVRVFRELIILSRKNNSHRTQLQIQILKSKCTELQTLNRGGVKKSSAEDVVVFQQNGVRFLQNFLRAAELSVSIFKLLQHRQGRKQVLAQNVQRLMGYLVNNKAILRRMLEINEYSHQVKYLLLKVYGQFYQDGDFLKETEKFSLEAQGLVAQRQLKKQLFSEKTTVIFVNILEQIGKIVRVSKNLPGVLGFIPSNLIGLSINQIIPFSIRPHHESTMLNFVQKYTDKNDYRALDLQFYAYNSDFHLQQVKVHYSWIMTDFDTFFMAGVIEKIESDANVILTDQWGFLEGWTRKIGTEEFNLDQLSIAQRKKFNILPLFPTLIKYMDSLGVYARTLFFKNQKSRDNNLIVNPCTGEGEDEMRKFQERLLGTFRKMLKEQEFVGMCFAEVEMSQLSFCGGRAKMLRFVIKHFEHVQNFSEINTMIQNLSFSNGSNRTEKSLAQPINEASEGSEKQQISIFSEDERADRRIDSNFTLNPQGTHIFPIQQLVFGQFNSSCTSFELTSIYRNHLNRRNDKQQKRNSSGAQANFSPSLSKNTTLLIYVLIVSIAAIFLVSLSMAAVSGTGATMRDRCKGVVKRNIAAMIYLKSIFNPNETFIDEFTNGQLLQNEPYLFAQTMNYTSFLGDSVTQNKFYLFNSQIPATLQRLLNNPIIYGNKTVPIIPPTNAIYYNQIVYNYQNVIGEFDRKFQDTQAVWANSVEDLRSAFFLRLGFLCVCSALYAWLLVVLYLRERAHKETLEAFFKFEREELQRKIGVIGGIIKQVQAQVSEWHLLKQFNEIVKRQEITNLQFGLVKNTQEIKIKFDYSPQAQAKLEQRKFYLAIIVLVLFLALQIVFLAVHAIITLNTLTYYKQTPADLDTTAKLIILPNYLLADLYLPLPSTIKDSYRDSVAGVISFPVASVPGLFNLLSTAPCSDCNFMYPVLTTNYKSFYSTFQQRVIQMKSSGGPDNSQVTDLFYAADYVVKQVLMALDTENYQYVDLSIVVFIVALGVLCAAIYWGQSSIKRQTNRLQLFLHFFSEEMITKNKHMNRLFSNTL